LKTMTDREDRYCDASAALVEELRTAYEKRVMWGEGDNMKKARTRLGLGPLSAHVATTRVPTSSA
jgi:hypothetical protein